MKKKKFNLQELLPFIILIVLVIIFSITTQGRVFTANNILMMVKQTLNVIIAGLGLIFVACMGATDITQGSLVAVCAAIGVITATDYSTVLAAPVAILIGALSGLILGVVNAKFKVPSFMASLAMLIGLRGLVSAILGSRSVMLPASLLKLDDTSMKLPIVILLLLIISYIFNKTPFGFYCKAIGENENAVRFSGVNVTKIKIFAFMLSGLMTGVASMFVLARVGGSSNVLGIGYEMRILMAMYIGGVPVRGGMGTKVYKLIVGAFMITLLESGLSISGVGGSYTQMIRGIVLLLVVYIMGVLQRRFVKAGA